MADDGVMAWVIRQTDLPNKHEAADKVQALEDAAWPVEQRCGTCRYREVDRWGTGTCRQLLFSQDDNGPTLCGEFCDVSVIVPDGFGCVLWKAKEGA